MFVVIFLIQNFLEGFSKLKSKKVNFQLILKLIQLKLILKEQKNNIFLFFLKKFQPYR